MLKLAQTANHYRIHLVNIRKHTNATRTWPIKAAIFCVMCCGSVGCQNWPGASRSAQQQIESERLLTEYRAQKKRADDLESRNRQLSERLGESEKMLARLQSGNSSSNRIASQPDSFSTTGYKDRSIDQYSADFRSQTAGHSSAPTRSSQNTSAAAADQPTWRARTSQ